MLGQQYKKIAYLIWPYVFAAPDMFCFVVYKKKKNGGEGEGPDSAWLNTEN